MIKRNDGISKDDICQNQFTAYVVLAVKRKRQSYIKKKQREHEKETRTKKEAEQSEFRTAGYDMWSRMEPQNEKLMAAMQQLSLKERFVVTEYVPLAGIFLRKLLRFCLSRLAIGSQNRTASGENSRCNKKAHPAFRQDARKIACGYFQANGINLVHFAPKSPVFCNFIPYLRHKISQWASSWGLG